MKLLDHSDASTTPMLAILEHVFSSSYVTLYIFKLKTVIKMKMVHLYSPNSKDEPDLAEQGK
jgi:hypothetical protein